MGNSEFVVLRKRSRVAVPSGKDAAALLAMVAAGSLLQGAKTNTKAKALRALAEKAQEVLPPKLLRSVPLAECKKVMVWLSAAQKHIDQSRIEEEDARHVQEVCNPGR